MERCAAPPLPVARQYEAVAAHYGAPDRFYHTLDHVGCVLYVVAALAAYTEHADTVRLAAWLHDLVYEPGARDNEARSAALAGQWLRDLGLRPAQRDEVQRLILLTASHETEAQDGNGAVLLDADLAVLGAPPATYDIYARAIRREYAHVDPHTYKTGRARLLQSFLARPALYHTSPIRAAYEGRARRNLARELELLV